MNDDASAPEERSVVPELRIVGDVAEEAVKVFLAVEPRTVLLSGGSTPGELYRRLRAVVYGWEEVEFFFGDERCVPPGHEHSNERMAREALLSHVPATVNPMDGAGCDAEGYERILRERFADRLSFDLALYGLGEDGHTASLFPGKPEAGVIDRWVVSVPEAGAPPFVPRLSLTVPALSAARTGMFLVSGEAKREALRKLISGEDIPASRLDPGRLLVIADPAAAGTLS